MATTLSPSGLVIPTTYGESGWAATYNTSFTTLNNSKLKLSGLLDIDVTGMTNGQVLRYEASSQKWKPYTPPVSAIKTYTTTTTSSSSTTTTSTSSTTTTAP
jgi:hypothetical protein